MMRISLSSATAQDQRQAPAGSLAWDPEYAEYLRWQATEPVAGRALDRPARDGGRG